jgi:hypothetical protein
MDAPTDGNGFVNVVNIFVNVSLEEKLTSKTSTELKKTNHLGQ